MNLKKINLQLGNGNINTIMYQFVIVVQKIPRVW